MQERANGNQSEWFKDDNLKRMVKGFLKNVFKWDVDEQNTGEEESKEEEKSIRGGWRRGHCHRGGWWGRGEGFGHGPHHHWG